MWQIIESALHKKGLTAYRMAKDLVIPVTTIYSWQKNGKIPKTDDLVAVSQYLGVDIMELIRAGYDYGTVNGKASC